MSTAQDVRDQVEALNPLISVKPEKFAPDHIEQLQTRVQPFSDAVNRHAGGRGQTVDALVAREQVLRDDTARATLVAD